MMVFRLARELTQSIAAVATFIANIPLENECSMPSAAIPILLMNSTKDPFMPFNGGMIIANGGQVLSFKQSVKFWLDNNHSNRLNPKLIFFDDNQSDKSHIKGLCYKADKKQVDSAETCAYQVFNGGHVTPSIKYAIPRWLQKRVVGIQNRDVEAADIAWQFFQKYQRR